MKKSRIFLACATATLAISAVFATKASKKFSNGFKTGVGFSKATVTIQLVSDLLTTVANNGGAVNYPLAKGAIVTAGGQPIAATAVELYTPVNGSVPMHWKN